MCLQACKGNILHSKTYIFVSILDPHKAGIQIKETGPNRIKYFFYILNANVFFFTGRFIVVDLYLQQLGLPRSEKCSDTEFFLVRIQENTEKKKLRI